jgi:hypothetical protein
MSNQSATTASNLVIVSSALRNVQIRSGTSAVVDMSSMDMFEAIGEAMEDLALKERVARKAKRSTRKLAILED